MKVSHRGVPCLLSKNQNRTKLWTPTLKRDSLLGNTPHILSHIIAKSPNAFQTIPLGKNPEKPAPALSWTLLHAPSTFAHFNQHLFSVISHNYEHNNFSESCESC